MAEDGGFEPPVPCGTHRFQRCALDHSANLPQWCKAYVRIYQLYSSKNIVYGLFCTNIYNPFVEPYLDWSSRYMKCKELFLTSALLLSSSVLSDHEYIKTSKESLMKSLSEKSIKETEKSVFYKFDVSEELLDELDTMDFEHKSDLVFSRNLSDLKNTPLFMKWTKRHIGEFLWYNQYDAILKKYDKDTLATKDNKAINSRERKSVSFPLIFDGLIDKIPANLHDILAQEKFEKYKEQIENQDTIIIVSKQDDGRHAIAYYVGGKLFLASYVSLGLGNFTPQWLFAIQERIFDKKSIKYKNAPMPYALHIHDNIFIHQWTANGQKKSHGCVRVPWLYQEILYHHVKRDTKVLIIP